MDIPAHEAGQSLDLESLVKSLKKVYQNGNTLSGMSQQILKEILCEPGLDILPGYLVRQEVPAGSYLWREGDKNIFLSLIVAGQVSMMKETEFKGHRFVVGVYNPITLLGEISFVDGQPRAMTAKALQDTEVFNLSRDNFEKMAKDAPLLGKKVIQGLLHLFSIRQRTLLGRMATIM